MSENAVIILPKGFYHSFVFLLVTPTPLPPALTPTLTNSYRWLIRICMKSREWKKKKKQRMGAWADRHKSSFFMESEMCDIEKKLRKNMKFSHSEL